MNPLEVDARTKNIQELEKLAAHIIALKESALPRRPIVIEFCGSPKAGKSTCISSLAMFLRRNEIRTTVITERGALCPIRNKFDPNFNIWAGCSGLAKFSEIMSNHPRDYDVVLMDRGFFDAVCWFYWQKTLKKLDGSHFSKFIDFFLAPKWVWKTNILYIFKAAPRISLQREHAHLLTTKTGTIMNEEVLYEFNKAVEWCRSEYGVHFQNVKTIDTSEKSQDEVSYQVTRDILDTLNGMIVEKIGHFDKRILSHIESEVFDPAEILDRVDHLTYSIRDDVEANDELLQLIPVAVITDPDERKVVIAKKLRAATSDSSPERRRDLVYFGGHIREEDELGRLTEPNLAAVASTALSRELKEELDIDHVDFERPKFCIWDRENPRSSKHVALVYHVKLNRQSLRIVADRKEFAERGAMIVDRGDLSARRPNFERWSQLIVEKILN